MKGTGKKRKIALVLLLVVLCIGGTELAACYFCDHALFDKITRPVRDAASAAASAVVDAGGRAVSAVVEAGDRAANWVVELTAPEEPAPDATGGLPDGQLVGAPVYRTDAPISDPSITELITDGKRDILTGGVHHVVYFNQTDAAWSGQSYGSDNIGSYGCGPTVMAMAIASLSATETTPVHTAKAAVEQGYWARRSGSYHSIVDGLSALYGLPCEPVTRLTTQAVQDALLSGKLLVALVGPGHFTNGGHFILLRGITLDGSILVADPASAERSLITWDPQLVLDELSTSRDSGAPLWAISAPVKP